MKYRNVSQNELLIPEVGIVGAGQEIESSIELNNIALELVGEAKEVAPVETPVAAPVAPAAAIAPAPVAPVAPVAAPQTTTEAE
jgi:hypothetical protein